MRRFLYPLTLMACCWCTPASCAESEAVAMGEQVEGRTTLRDLRGNRRPLQSFKDNEALVLVFLGSECPISNVYLPTLKKMEEEYRTKKVQFLAIYPNEHEDLDKVGSHSYDHDLPFPVLKDTEQQLADLVGIQRVPAVAILDKECTLRYRGHVNDQYGVGFRRPKPTREDLRLALEEVLANKKVTVTETEIEGCLIDRATKREPDKSVTFNKQVVRILQKRCQTCHRPDQAAPFSLLRYEDAVRHARMIKEVTTQRRMPPWHADPRYGKFVNDRSMTPEEIETLAVWVDSGMPRGDKEDLPKPIDWPEGWGYGEPDVVFEMPEEFEVPADGVLPYKYFTVQTNFDEDKWVQFAEARPGARSVVHHIVVYILTGDQTRPFSLSGNMSVLVGWAPGDLGTYCPDGVALRLPKGARLLFEMHYTPNGKKVKDRSKIGVTFAKEPPKYEMLMNAFANESIKVPPRDPHYKAEATFRIRSDARVIAFVPHMHWRGKNYFYEVIYPDGQKKTVLSVPRWDFNWQSTYQFEEPLRLPKGSKIHSVAHWDNSKNNPYNPDPSKTVYFGLQTWDEMMVGWIAYVWENPDLAKKQKVDPMDLFFDRMDRNGDEIITSNEIPDRMKPLLFLAGIKTPEKMDRKSFVGWFTKVREAYDRTRKKKNPPAGSKEKGK